MATTFKISNGDTVLNTSTGRPKLIGNPINENNIVQSELKSKQDIRRSLSINRVLNGTGAAIAELVGNVESIGVTSVQLLLNKRIRDMFAAILKEQNRRLGSRPLSERFAEITLLTIIEERDKISFRFRLDTRTITDNTIVTSGIVG